MSIYGNPVYIGSSGGVNWGTSLPTAAQGKDGDVYLYLATPYSTEKTRTYDLLISRALRGSNELTYAGAEEIKLIFSDGNGGEADIRNLTGFTYSVTLSGAGSKGTPSYAFDGNTDTYWEAYYTPLTMSMSATVPAGYVPLRLEVYQRTGSYNTDVWSTFSVTETMDGGDISTVILSEEMLAASDWAGASNWTTFAFSGQPSGVTISEVYIKSGGAWVPFDTWINA